MEDEKKFNDHVRLCFPFENILKIGLDIANLLTMSMHIFIHAEKERYI